MFVSAAANIRVPLRGCPPCVRSCYPLRAPNEQSLIRTDRQQRRQHANCSVRINLLDEATWLRRRSAIGIVRLRGRDVVRLSSDARERAEQPRSTVAIGMNREVLGFSPSGSLEQVFVFGEVPLRQLTALEGF
jgi:hypothetical protein